VTTKSCFPTLIYYDFLTKSQISLKKLSKEMLKEAYLIKESDEEGQEWSEDNFKGGYTSYSSNSSLHLHSSTFAKFKKHLDAHVKSFAKSLEYDIDLKKLEIVSCWVNIVPQGCFHSLHIHPLSAISGTFYLQTPKRSGDLRLEDPRMSRFMAAPPKKESAHFRNQSQLYFKPTPGKLILFESWLRHEVEQNMSEQDRVSVSFNYGWL